jgi:hypothetical protein
MGTVPIRNEWVEWRKREAMREHFVELRERMARIQSDAKSVAAIVTDLMFWALPSQCDDPEPEKFVTYARAKSPRIVARRKK